MKLMIKAKYCDMSTTLERTNLVLHNSALLEIEKKVNEFNHPCRQQQIEKKDTWLAMCWAAQTAILSDFKTPHSSFIFHTSKNKSYWKYYLYQVDSSGVHVNGEGKYGFCSSDCNPSVSLAAILGGLVFEDTNTANTVTKTAKLETQGGNVSFRRLKASTP